MDSAIFNEVHRHVVLVAYGAWGHIRPLCALAARIVKARPVYITMFTTPSFHDRVYKEISRNFDEQEADACSRLRLVALASNGDGFLEADSINSGFEKSYQDLIQERPLNCAATLTVFPALPSPDAAVLDVFANTILAIIRTHSKKQVKTYCWVVCSASAYHSHLGIASPNKNGGIHAVILEEAERSGRSASEIAADIFFSAKGEVKHIPGLPPMYDHEEYPQDVPINLQLLGMLRMGTVEVSDGCDGMIIATSHHFETPETLGPLSQYFGGKVHLVGPLLPTAVNAHSMEKAQSMQAQEIDEFMTRISQSHGSNSLLYVSFGSVFWPTEPTQIWTFIDVLIERKIPFIFSHASPLAEIPDDIKAKVKDSGLGMLSSWSPQQHILAHPVTSWFVTHCGFNSVLESIHSGVPMICWPYQADQPVIAVHLTENLDIAFELFEVRAGHGLKPIYRIGKAPTGTPEAIRRETNDVLDKAFGEAGKNKRIKVKRLQEDFSRAWEEKGTSRLALQSFLETVYSS